MDTVTIFIPGGKHLPDNDQWTNRFEIKSASSNRVYIVAQNIKGQHFACSCPGWKTHRICKHIKSIQKIGRQAAVEVRTLPHIGNRLGDASFGRSTPAKDPTLGYRTYEGARGSEQEWGRAFAYRMGLDAARKAVGKDSPRGILGVTATATFEEIRRAWRKLVMKFHPDNSETGDAAAFRRIQGAYEILEYECRG